MTSIQALRFRERVEILCFLEYTVYIKNNTFFQEEEKQKEKIILLKKWKI